MRQKPTSSDNQLKNHWLIVAAIEVVFAFVAWNLAPSAAWSQWGLYVGGSIAAVFLVGASIDTLLQWSKGKKALLLLRSFVAVFVLGAVFIYTALWASACIYGMNDMDFNKGLFFRAATGLTPLGITRDIRDRP